MRYLIFILILAACTVPPNVQKTEAAPVAVELPIEVNYSNEAAQEKPKEKPRPKPKAAPVSPCADIDTGDVRESINLKLDCLLLLRPHTDQPVK